MNQSTVERVVAIVDKTLRGEFPTDFDKRCAYSAFAICLLMREAGSDAHIVGGNFAAFVVGRSGAPASMQGYGYDPNQCAHFWVEAEGHIIDLGPHYLPRKSGYPAADMPVSVWNKEKPLPSFLRYQALEVFPSSSRMNADPAIEARSNAFNEKCKSRFASKLSVAKLKTWLLTDLQSVARAAAKQDVWAKGALRFATGNFPTDLTF